jgi:hypothetical protein
MLPHHFLNGVDTNLVLPPFLFSCRWIVQFYTIQRQLKRNGWSTMLEGWKGHHAQPKSQEDGSRTFFFVEKHGKSSMGKNPRMLGQLG